MDFDDPRLVFSEPTDIYCVRYNTHTMRIKCSNDIVKMFDEDLRDRTHVPRRFFRPDAGGEKKKKIEKRAVMIFSVAAKAALLAFYNEPTRQNKREKKQNQTAPWVGHTVVGGKSVRLGVCPILLGISWYKSSLRTTVPVESSPVERAEDKFIT